MRSGTVAAAVPTASNPDDGTGLYYETAGSGETVAFVGDVGFGAWQWSWQHAALAGPYEVLVTDLRGCGRSDAPPGPYDVATLATDLRAVLGDHGARRAHLVGAGLGGMVALRVALDASRPASVALVGTAAAGADLPLDPLFAPPDDSDALAASLRAACSEAFLAAHPDAVDRIVEWRAAEDADRTAWEAQAAAATGFDLRDRLHEVTTPALVLHGTADAVCPPGAGRRLAEGLPRGTFEPVDGAGHLATVDTAAAVNDRILAFLGA